MMRSSQTWSVLVLVLVLVLVSTLASCSDDDGGTPTDAGTPTDTGAPPPDGSAGGCAAPARCTAIMRDLGVVVAGARAHALTVVGADVLVSTEMGVFRRPLDGTGAWEPSGLAGLEVISLERHPTRPMTVLAGLNGSATPTIRVSIDGGRMWQERGTELLDPFSMMHDPVSDFALGDGDTLFANTAASAIVRSVDSGTSWTYVDGMPGLFGYSCYIALDGAALLQGCELPLDDAWIDRLPITTDGVGPRTRLVGTADISNRRPNSLVTSMHFPGVTWAGLEGGLIRMESDRWAWIHQGGAVASDVEYVYVRGTWIDPGDQRHLVYGGLRGTPELPLFETFDQGPDHALVAAPAGASAVSWDIVQLATTGDAEQILVMAVNGWSEPNGVGTPTARVFVREHD